MALGYITDHAGSYVSTSGSGSIACGGVVGDNSKIYTDRSGSLAGGYIGSDGSYIYTAKGSFAWAYVGYQSRTGAGGSGSWMGGYFGNSSHCYGGGEGSFTFGAAYGGYQDTIVNFQVSAFAWGAGAYTTKDHEWARSATTFAAMGDAQERSFLGRVQTTDATQTELLIQNALGGTTNFSLPNDTSWLFEVRVSARRTDANDETAAYFFRGSIDRNASAATTGIVGAIDTLEIEDTAAWDVTVDADTTNGSLRIRVTGEAAKTVNWLAKISVLQVTG